VICPTCHGKGNKWAMLTEQYITCMDCNGSGTAYCCEHYDDVLTHGVNAMLTKIEYFECTVDPNKTGYYIHEFKDAAALNMQTPSDVIGPFATRLAAARRLVEPDEEQEAPTKSVKRKPPYDPSRDPIPARSTEASEAGDVHVELQQVEELRDLPEALQGD